MLNKYVLDIPPQLFTKLFNIITSLSKLPCIIFFSDVKLTRYELRDSQLWIPIEVWTSNPEQMIDQLKNTLDKHRELIGLYEGDIDPTKRIQLWKSE